MIVRQCDVCGATGEGVRRYVLRFLIGKEGRAGFLSGGGGKGKDMCARCFRSASEKALAGFGTVPAARHLWAAGPRVKGPALPPLPSKNELGLGVKATIAETREARKADKIAIALRSCCVSAYQMAATTLAQPPVPLPARCPAKCSDYQRLQSQQEDAGMRL